ncbi:MAG: TonB C-terminal domain-containing protein [Candidatus Obscuribacterales bacterium]|nr:TonB C-terminal domain-containing protein [Candidatus Obscuribacterales bacterium]
MATVLERPVQALADSTGFIIDRTQTPEKIIGQAWLISKSRVVCLASSVTNYNEAPWALMIRFPHPDLTYAVKAISLHPDFNRRAARDFYLSQLNMLTPQSGYFDNDIATVTMETEIQELQPEKVQELNRALSLPLQIAPGSFSNVMRAGDTGNILQAALGHGDGVLTMYDERKIPFARIALRQRKVLRAVYAGLTNEFAVCELMWRRPGGMYAMTNEDVVWPNVPEIAMGTDQLAAEAMRRNAELPRILDQLGGPSACFVRTSPNFDFAKVPPQSRWVIERLWPALDGFLPLSKLSERLRIDSYTAVLAVRDLMQLGVIADAGKDHFHRTGQLGPPLTPGADTDLAVWDVLQAFYLDECSGAPMLATGNYFGSSSLLTPRTLLHTALLPSANHGAALIKDQRLIGIHNGQYVAANPQNMPPFSVSQMIWIGSLSELGAAKRLRAVESDADDSEQAVSSRQAASGLRRSYEPPVVPDMEPHPPKPEEESREPAFLRRFSRLQIVGAGACMFGIGFIMAINSILSAPRPVPVPQPVPQVATKTSTTTDVGDPAVAVATAQEIANFIDPPIAPFKYEDTSALTKPKKSFGLTAEGPNLRLLFVEFPVPVHTMKSTIFKTLLPTVPFWGHTTRILTTKSDTPALYYEVYESNFKQEKPKDPLKTGLFFIGVIPAVTEDKCIVVLGEPFKKEGKIDFVNAASIITRMRAALPAAVPATDTGAASDPAAGTAPDAATTEATPEQIEAYKKTVFGIIKSIYKHPSNSETASRCEFDVKIGPDGMARIEQKQSSAVDSVDKTLLKAIAAKQPYAAPPGKSTVEMKIILEDGELTLE